MGGRFAFLVLTLSAASPAALAQTEHADLQPADWIIFDSRYRVETVDQEGLARDAVASTWRTRLGFETTVSKGFSFLAEAEFVQNVGADRFNSTANGRTNRPVVADPNAKELNRLQMTYSGWQNAELTLGRQRINLDNQRFVGAVGFRQNEQTFDAARLTVKLTEKIKADYVYSFRVNRIFGEGNPGDDFEGDIHLANLSAAINPTLKLSVYHYNLRLDEARALSTVTTGLRVGGKAPLTEDWKISYTGEAAFQRETNSNPVQRDHMFFAGEAALAHGQTSFALGFESLDGDGQSGFSTPLATLHKFQGFADAFLATPANGINDYYARAIHKFGAVGPLQSLNGGLWYHMFDSENSGADLGDEIDARLWATFNKYLSAEFKMALFDGADGPASRDKFWFSITAKY